MNGSGTAEQVDRGAASPGVSAAGAREVDPLTVTRRLQREGRWKQQAEQTRDDLMKAAKGQFADKEARQAWVYAELDRMYPPLRDTDTVVVSQADSGQIQGLADPPQDWPELPANACLSTEIGWVQANRLRIVEERPGKATQVRLDQAIAPAPSWAALGWLETSIRSYAKFVDVAVKVGGGEDGGEEAWVKRERKSIAEIDALLKEMQAAEGECPTCGRSY